MTRFADDLRRLTDEFVADLLAIAARSASRDAAAGELPARAKAATATAPGGDDIEPPISVVRETAGAFVIEAGPRPRRPSRRGAGRRRVAAEKPAPAPAAPPKLVLEMVPHPDRPKRRLVFARTSA